MPSPFPGMNPYLEQNDSWQEFHNDYLMRAREALALLVGPNYLVKTEVRLLLHELSAEERRLSGVADLGISHTPRSGTAVVAAARASTSERLQFPAVETEQQLWLEIRDRRNRQVVTVLELLSPSNKSHGPDRDTYINKRNITLVSRTNFVELDFLRGGVRPPLPTVPPCAYSVLVCRGHEYPEFEWWSLGLRDRLPVIPIPLRPADGDVLLDLQDVLHRTYDAADFGKYIYSETPDPPLGEADAAWARQFLVAPPAA